MLNRNEKKEFNLSKYVNIETGELLSDEIDFIDITKNYDEFKRLKSKEFTILDSIALDYIEKRFTHIELGRILLMSRMVSGPFNILFDIEEGKNYTKKTLMARLGMAQSPFNDLMRKLVAESIIAYSKGVGIDGSYKWIMFNPYLSRKRNNIHQDCACKFNKLVDINLSEIGKKEFPVG